MIATENYKIVKKTKYRLYFKIANGYFSGGHYCRFFWLKEESNSE